MFLRDENVPFSWVVDFEDFSNNTMACLKEFRTHTPHMCYLLVKHKDPDSWLVHWTPESKLEGILTNGIKASGDNERSDFGKGVYCFMPRCPDSSYSDGEKRVPVFFKSKVWFQCVATDDSPAPIRYCFVRNDVKRERLSLSTFEPDETWDTVETLRRMGFNSEFRNEINITLWDRRSLREICELFN